VHQVHGIFTGLTDLAGDRVPDRQALAARLSTQPQPVPALDTTGPLRP
jgi:hypothetical protein